MNGKKIHQIGCVINPKNTRNYLKTLKRPFITKPYTIYGMVVDLIDPILQGIEASKKYV